MRNHDLLMKVCLSCIIVTRVLPCRFSKGHEIISQRYRFILVSHTEWDRMCGIDPLHVMGHGVTDPLGTTQIAHLDVGEAADVRTRNIE
jgi:hypothetical protein